MWGSRAFTKDYVPGEIFSICNPFTPDGIRRLKQIPAVICNMSLASKGEIDPKQKAVYARITRIFDIPRDNGARDLEVHFEKLGAFPLSKMCIPGIAQFFNMQLVGQAPTYTQIGWYIFQRNLFEAFDAADIDGMSSFPT